MIDEREIANAEWLDSDPGAASKIELPEPDEDYCYAGMRLFSWWPVVNTRGATYEREDFSDDLLGTLLGKQVNLEHDKYTKVVGSIVAYAANADGVDIAVRIDREQAGFHGLSTEDMRSGNYFSHCSLELTKDPEGSHFYAYDDGFNVQKTIPVIAGRRMGIRRTKASDPFTLQGLRVAERIKPARFTGVGLVPRPADQTAELYAVTASDDEADERLKNSVEPDFIELLSEDYDLLVADTFEQAADKKALTPGSNYADPGYKGVKKYPLDSEAHVRSAARFWGIPSYRAGYNPAQQAHISAAIARAKKKFGIGDSAEKANTPIGDTTPVSASDLQILTEKVTALEGQVSALNAEKETASNEKAAAVTRVTELETEVETLKTELASANEKIATYEQEKASAEREVKINALVEELHGIHPVADEDRAALRERAALACDDDGVIRELKHEFRDLAYEARVKALEEREAALKAGDKPAGAKPADVGGPSKGKEPVKEGEQASDEFVVVDEDARQSVVPTVLSIGGKTVAYEPGKFI